MDSDIRKDVAMFYDLNPGKPFKDVDFYKSLITSEKARILELGCGTGRVLIPLTDCSDYIYGIDLSEAMIEICKQKLRESNIGPEKVRVEIGDITDLNLEEKFDLIIAPFRVMQNLEENEQVDGLFESIEKHLSKDGSAILNVFHPCLSREDMAVKWCSEEKLDWELPVGEGKVACYDKRERLNAEKQVLYPDLIYRKYGKNGLEKESVHKLVMRYYYPDEFEKLITDNGFQIINKWGGYSGEEYGSGSELVIHFKRR